MAGTTIGRVEFIVDLDGDKLPAQARALGKQIGAAGKSAGKDFGEEFESEFDKSLTSIGKRASTAMNKAGRAGGESFIDSFEKSVRRKADSIQDSLADTLADKGKLEKALSGFDDLSEGVVHYERELEALTKKTVTYTDELGNQRTEQALTNDEIDAFRDSILEAAVAVDDKREADAKALAINEKIRVAQEDLNDQIYRMNELSRDGSALRQAANREGRDYADVAADMRREMEGLNQQQQVSNRDFATFSDTLERTVENLRKADDAVIESAKNKVKSDLTRAISDAAVAKSQKERADSAKELGDAHADLDRKMGNLAAYKEYVRQVGDVETANSRLRASFDDLGDLGASSRTLVGFENKLKSYNDTLENSTKKTKNWADSLSSPLDGVTGAWRRMDGTVKLVVASIIGAGDQVAVLGSALGAGLVALGGGLTSLIVGAGAGFAVVSNLFQDLEDAPEHMKPTIRSFKDLGDAFKEVGDSIASNAFDEIGDGFLDMRDAIKALEPALDGVGRVLGRSIGDFGDAIKPGTEGFKLLEATVTNAEGNLQIFMRTLGTFGGALLRAFDGAQPLVQDLFVWMERLADQFDAFTRGANFDTWITNAQAVFGSFSGTLDAVSLALHNLVTPEAVERTTLLLDNLARMAPGLGELLNVVGTLDPFGILVSIFADLAEQFERVAPAALVVADTLNAILMAAPPELWAGTAIAVGTLTTAIVGLKVASAVGSGFDLLATKLGYVGNEFGKTASKAGKFGTVMGGLGKAGLIGGTVVVFLELLDVVKDYAREQANLDPIIRHAIASHQALTTTVQKVAGATDEFASSTKDLKGGLDGLGSWNDGNIFAMIGEAFGSGSNAAHDLNAALNELDNGMQDLDVKQQSELFTEWTKELGATDDQILEMLDSTPKFKKKLEEMAIAEDGAASDADLLRLALEGTIAPAENSLDAFVELTGGLEEGASAAELQADALELLTGKSLGALDAVEGVAEGITTLGSAFRSHESAASDYEAALDAVTSSIEENGTEWRLSEEAGRANQETIRQLAESTLALASENYNLTGSAEDAAAAIATGRQAVLDQLAAFGIVGPEAEAYADKLGLIPGDVETLISANTEAGMEMADAFATRLYELGLIETDPVATLNAEQAKAEAAAVQAQLDALDTSVHVTTLDANGDPVGAVLESTATNLFGFDNTKYTTELDANGDPMYAVLEESANKLSVFDTTKHTTTLDANGDPVGGVVEATAAKLQDFATTKYTTTLDANGDPAGGVVEKTSLAMDDLASQKVITTLDANDAKAKAKVSEVTAALTVLDGSVWLPKIDADNKKATEKTKATDEALKNIGRTTYMPRLDVDNTDALLGTQQVKTGLDNIKSKTVTITVNTYYPNGRPNTARGGMFFGEQVRTIAEAGPEAVVPLRRPLSQVDPAVRALSAFAQGIALPGADGGSSQLNGGGGGGRSGSSRVVNVAPGAIVIQGDRAPETTATNVVNRLAQRIAG